MLGWVLARSDLRGSEGGRGGSWPAAGHRSVVQLSPSFQHIKMKTLPKTLFSGGENISENDKKKLFVNNFSDNIETVLGDFAWNGKATGVIGLTLSNDNRRVESGRFYTRGVLQERSIKVAASEIWENAHESVTLTIKLPEPRCSSSQTVACTPSTSTRRRSRTTCTAQWKTGPPFPSRPKRKKSGKTANSASGRCVTSAQMCRSDVLRLPQHEAE